MSRIKEFMKSRGIDTIVTLDYETFYAQGYSLRSPTMSTTEYIRDEKFKAHGVGLRNNRQKSGQWFTHNRIAKGLGEYDWSRTAMLAHHTHFDGLIASHHHGTVPCYYLDTLSMARAIFSHAIGLGLDEVAKFLGLEGKVRKDALESTKGILNLTKTLDKKLGEYCIDDVNDTWDIFKIFMEDFQFPFPELDLIHHTVKCYADPVIELDVGLATEALEEEKLRRRTLFLSVADMLGIEATEEHRLGLVKKRLSSNGSFAALLREHDIEPPLKINSKGQKVYAFAAKDPGFSDLADSEDPNVKLLHAARLAARSKVLPIDSIIEAADIVHVGHDDDLRADLAAVELSSADKFADLLVSLGVDPPTKTSPTTGELTYAFAKNDLEFQDLGINPDDRVRLVYEARLAAKSTIGESRAARLLSHGAHGCPIPIYLNYCKAHTMRWSGGDKMNPQNFGRKSKLRRALRAPRRFTWPT